MHQIVIIGGGAGGLELAARLGDTLGRKGRVCVTRVDLSRTHLWKPLLHELHVYAPHGLAKMLFDTLAKLITRRTEPRVKLR